MGYQGIQNFLTVVYPSGKQSNPTHSLSQNMSNEYISSDHELVKNSFERMGQFCTVMSNKRRQAEVQYDMTVCLSVMFTDFHIS